MLFLKKAQIGVEYMIIIGFVTFAVLSVLSIAIIYSDKIKDRIRLNQIDNFGTKLVSFSEEVFFSGEPSKTTINLYLPEGVESIEIDQNYIIITTRTSSGENKRAYKSKVPIQGIINSGQGIKKISLEAKEDYLLIS